MHGSTQAVRDQIMQHQQRAATIQECEQLEADILTLQADSEKLDRLTEARPPALESRPHLPARLAVFSGWACAMQVRRKQVALLLHCLDELEAEVLEEDEGAAEPGAAEPDEGGPVDEHQPMETG